MLRLLRVTRRGRNTEPATESDVDDDFPVKIAEVVVPDYCSVRATATVARTEKSVKFGRLVFEIRARTDTISSAKTTFSSPAVGAE